MRETPGRKIQTFPRLHGLFVLLNLPLILSAALLVTSASLTSKAQTPGSLDATFEGDGKASIDVGMLRNEAFAVAVQPDGKIIVAGNNVSAAPDEIILARFQTNGLPDPTFGSAGIVASEIDARSGKIRSIALQPDGKIIVAGSISVGLASGDFLLVRYNPNGTLDTSFGGVGWVTTSYNQHHDDIHSIILQPDGKIIAAGKVTDLSDNYKSNFALTRYNADGSLDPTFGVGGKLETQFGAAARAASVVLQADGKIVAAGETRVDIFTSNFDIAVARYNPNGTLDSTFGTGGKVIADLNNRYNLARSATIQPDGKIIVGGEAVTGNNMDFALTRFTATGVLDTNFGTGGSVTTNVSGDGDAAGEARSIVLQPDGKILFAGKAGEDFGLIRYNADGSLDSNFGSGGKVTTDFIGTPDTASALTLQPNGKIVVVGSAVITPAGTGVPTSDFAVARYHSGLTVNSRAKFDFDGDARADISVYRSGTWYLQQSQNGFAGVNFGISSDKLAPADYDGDGKTDIAVFRDGNWYLLRSSDGAFFAAQFGISGDVPLPADFDGDGRAELAVYRGGTWFTLNLSNNQFQSAQFGAAADKPVPADYDGDAKNDFGVYREGVWYWLQSSNNQLRAVQFGIASDKPVIGDYDGDGHADPAVYRSGVWYILGSARGFYAAQFGVASDVPVPADYDGDGKSDIAVFRDGTWYLLESASNQFRAAQFGLANDRPIPAAFNN